MEITFLVINSVILVTTVLECLIVFGLLSQDFRNRRISHNFVISLCVADLVHAIFGCGVLIHMASGLKLIDSSCHLEVTLLTTAHTISLVCTIVTSLDRYFAIGHPLEYQAKMTDRKSFVIIGVGWVVGACVGLSSLFFEQDRNKLRPVVMERLNTTSCILIGNVLKPGFLVFVTFFFIFPCILVTIGLNVAIFGAMNKVFNSTAVKSSKRSFFAWLQVQRELENAGDLRLSDMLKVREVRATLILFFTVIVFLLCWVPAVVILIVHKIRPILGSVTEMFLVCTVLKVYSMINPVIYAFTLKDIRRALKRFLCRAPQAETEGKITRSTTAPAEFSGNNELEVIE
ncbi:adenosine receptor A2b-like [Culicoides brevitarsis]|uniref:adenosine receptor A2b-like n=1 Tax=Culicoides brevitarsis TaxID=469753 RepID=UPI00307B7182